MQLWETWRLAKRIIREHQLRIEFHDLRPPLDGFYIRYQDNAPIIGLACRILTNPILLRCTLWEEIGHHFTTSESDGLVELYSTSDRSNDLPDEKRALWWASQRLISDLEIAEFFAERSGGLLSELAHRFQVTEEMACERLNALQHESPELWKGIIDLMLAYKPSYRVIG